MQVSPSDIDCRRAECDEIFSSSVEMLDFARLAGSSNCPILLSGETGSGKTHLARLVHRCSSRARMPFVRVNCSSIPETLFEREMFGHVRGAYTDAREGGAGFLETAHRGTLFLDEVGELPLAVQAKLLAVLEDGVFRRLGSPRESVVDVRVLAATNRDLTAMVRERQFRQDLYYRLSVIQYQVPPLRDRPDELCRVVDTLLRRHSPTTAPVAISEAVRELIRGYAWPGNIRELDNALRAALVFSRGASIEPEHLPPNVRAGAARACERYAAPQDPEEESGRIRRALAEAGGNKAQAARDLGMSRSTLWAKLQRYEP
jgi:transcriptional regulator with PAS, ATPase and Fis domain